MLFKQVLSLVPCAVFWKDKNGIFQGCNQLFLTFSGLTDKCQLIGKHDRELPWADRWKKYAKDDHQVMAVNQIINYIEEISLPDREIISKTTKTPWLSHGRIVGVLGVIYDITDLVLAKKQAETISQLKSEFVKNMQHDIRTPTSGLWSGLQMLTETEEDSDKKAILILLRDSAKQLFDICNEIIDFDKIERGEALIFSKPIDIRKILSNVVDLNYAIAYQKKLKLSFDVDDRIPEILKGDEYRISRILINLVSNAIKFTEKGSVRLLAKLLKLTDKQAIVQLEVHDTGTGILDEKKEFIYEKFVRGDPSNRGKYKGSGLGLNIVKQFVSELNGELEVQSEVGKGTVFYVRLTLEKPSTETALEDE